MHRGRKLSKREEIRIHPAPQGLIWTDVLHGATLAATLCVVTFLMVQRVRGSGETLVGDLVVDDAFYYLVPARHLLAGQGYSFDGQTRTNGVQPLWAVIVIGLSAVIHGEFALVRSLAIVSGAMWVLAGWVLYRSLRRLDRWLALFVATGWWCTGFWNRIAFQGMENGLHALLASLLVWFGLTGLARSPEPEQSPTGAPHRDKATFYLYLGLLLALFTLARVDSALLALLIGAGVLVGLIRPNGRVRWGLNLRGALLLALPGAVLVGGYALFSKLYFGAVMPISGTVKLHYEHVWGYNYGGPLGSLAWHFRFIFDIATYALSQVFARGPWAAQSQALVCGLCLAGAVGLAFAALRRRRLGRGAPRSAWGVYTALLALFALAHLVIYALTLSHFTAYTTWYFAPELMTAWVLLGVLAYAAGALPGLIARPSSRLAKRGARGVCGALGVFTAFAAARTDGSPPHDVRTNAFLAGARWVERHVPESDKLGAFSAGILGYFAPHHQTVNFDGLMNDADYFRDYLAPGRIPDYARDRQIAYLCDYAPLNVWKAGGFWGFDVKLLQLVYWRRMGPDLGYAIWKLHPASPRADFLAPCEGLCDRLAQVQYAAEVLGRFPTVDDDDPNALAAATRGGAWVFTSIVQWPERRLRHVLLTPAEAASVDLRRKGLDLAQPQCVTFDHSVRLLGIDVPASVCARGGRFIVTRYWQKLAAARPHADVSFELWVNPSQPGRLDEIPVNQRLVHYDRGCYGTHPLQNWQPNEIVAETYSIVVPDTLPAGSYPLMLGLHDPQSGWLLPDTAGAGSDNPLVFLTEINVQ